ncbi:hypothetical protein GCM10009810_34040 [Nostocoides vanveenii]|uniref:Uncharacterized protein n=1 Tax=Nostocoides vanveenii TaxID=330835 RepID=A0ABN2L4Q8_9MICO
MDVTDWVEDGVTPHPTGGYVSVEVRSDQTVYRDADGHRHRVDGPAVVTSTGKTRWFRHGILHRLDGPAYANPGAVAKWFVDGRRHRLDGPAVVHSQGHRQWWLHDRRVSEAEHAEIVARWQETGEAPHT